MATALESITKVIADTRVDAVTLKEFVTEPADVMVKRRLGDDIHTLEYYLNNFEINRASITAYVATIPNIVNNAINNTAVEGGVLADTFVTATANMLGSVARTQRQVNSDYINVNAFGDFAVSPKTVLQKAIDEVHLAGGGLINIPQGLFDFSAGGVVLKENVYLLGAGEGLTIFDQGEFVGDLIATPIIAETPLTMTTDLNEGDIGHTINNSCTVGDFIKFSSNRLFTDRWSDRLIRAYYKEGELFEVARRTPTTVGFNKAGFAICKISDGATAITFKPTKNMGIQGLTLRKSASVVNSSRGLFVNQASGFQYDKITTENYDNAGITINKSIGTTVGTVHHLGGSDTLGLCYGTSITDGSKSTTISSISGDGCRHVMSGGGTGWAIPAHATVLSIKGVNSKKAAIDTHGNTAYFSYLSAQVDCIGGMSGLGHIMSNVVGLGVEGQVDGGTLHVYEGGKGITYNNIRGIGHGRWVSQESVIESTFNGINLSADKFESLAFRSIGSRSNGFYDITLTCDKAANATSVAEADACHTTASVYGLSILMHEDSTLDGLKITGFPFVFNALKDGMLVKNIKAKNCGWRTLLVTGRGALNIATGNNSTVDGVDIENTNTSLLWAAHGLRMSPTAAVQNFTLANVRTSKTVAGALFYNAVYASDLMIKPFLFNVHIKSSGGLGTFLVTSGTYINQNLTAETYTKV